MSRNLDQLDGRCGAASAPAESVGQLSLSLDYFDVKVDNGVSDLSGATILSRCYSNPNFDANAGFCRFVQRDANQALTVTSSFVNLSENIVKGYEFNGRYARDLFGGKFVFNANVTKYTEQSTRLFPEEFLTDANGIVTSPEWVGNFDANYTVRPMTVRYGLDWIGGDHNKTYNYFAFDNLTASPIRRWSSSIATITSWKRTATSSTSCRCSSTCRRSTSSPSACGTCSTPSPRGSAPSGSRPSAMPRSIRAMIMSAGRSSRTSTSSSNLYRKAPGNPGSSFSLMTTIDPQPPCDARAEAIRANLRLALADQVKAWQVPQSTAAARLGIGRSTLNNILNHDNRGFRSRR